MRGTVLLAAAALCCAVASAAAAELSDYKPPSVPAASITRLRAHVNGMRMRKCLPPHPVREPALLVPHGLRPWVLKLWQRRHRIAHSAGNHCAARWAVLERGFHGPLRLAARTFGVSYDWLHACDHSEGSDRMVPNHHGSGAFGPMQFLSGTFYSNVGPAFARARAAGVAIPSRYARWDSNVGQAFTAAYMFAIGQSGQWTGAGC